MTSALPYRAGLWFALVLPSLLLLACGSESSMPIDAGVAGDAERLPLPQIAPEDLPAGFNSIPFYHDVPGLLRDLDDPLLAATGTQARQAGRAAGQGFANSRTGELIFMIIIRMDALERAQEVVHHIREQPIESVLGFISPDETLFDSEHRPAPKVGDIAVSYFLRYGVEEAGSRPRDVATDLLIFSEGRDLVFVLRSVNQTEPKPADVELLDLASLARTISIRNEHIQAGEEPQD